MALLRCEGTYDGYEDDWDLWLEELERERQFDDLADKLYNEMQRGDITESQARVRFVRAQRAGR